MAAAFAGAPVRDYRTLLREHDKAMGLFGSQDHFFRPGPLSAYLDCPAVTIQASEDGLLGRFWLSPGVRTGGAALAAAFNDGRCSGFVGADDRAIWLTPLTGEVADLLTDAQDRFCTPSKRGGIVRRLIAYLGLSHIKPTAEILALVTRETLGEILFERPEDRVQSPPLGSTAIEARGHRRFRAWPRHQPGTYGRTYDTDEEGRTAAGSQDYGAVEAVCPRLPVSAFRECIFLGQLTVGTVDDAEAYLGELGVADKTAPELLLQLADVIGL